MKIKEIRRAKNLTQNQLAEKIGVSNTVIAKYESGTVTPPLYRLEAMAKAMDVTVEALLGKEEPAVMEAEENDTSYMHRMAMYNTLIGEMDKVVIRNNTALKKQLIARSGGKCELCGNDAPFTGPGGLPYLELHYVKWLSLGGTDTADNAVVLCPNCNRKIATMNNPEDTAKLYSIAKTHK